jgi:hypothetical protein
MIGQKVIILKYWAGEIGIITRLPNGDDGVYLIDCSVSGVGGFFEGDFIIATPLTEALI